MGAEPFVEFGAESINYVVEKHWDRAYDSLKRKFHPKSNTNRQGGARKVTENTAPLALTSDGQRRTHKTRLSSPQGNVDSCEKKRHRESIRAGGDARDRDVSLDRRTETSEPVLRAYESGSRDPIRTPETSLSHKALNKSRNDSRMSYSQAGLAPGYQQQQQQQRANSAQPPRSRYYDDDDEYGSDYDDRNGRRNTTTGRGYDDRYEDDRGGPYDREVIETERYRGPARDFDARRQSFRGNDPYGPGAVAPYQNQRRQDDDYSRRSRSRGSRGRRNSERGGRDRSGSRSRSYSRSRSRSGSRERGGSIQHKIGEHFDTSLQGLGVGLAGAVVGGMAGRHYGERDPKHRNRDILLGALVGGLGANAAETKWKGYTSDKKRDVREDEEKWENRYDSGGYGRSRSAMR